MAHLIIATMRHIKNLQATFSWLQVLILINLMWIKYTKHWKLEFPARSGVVFSNRIWTQRVHLFHGNSTLMLLMQTLVKIIQMLQFGLNHMVYGQVKLLLFLQHIQDGFILQLTHCPSIMSSPDYKVNSLNKLQHMEKVSKDHWLTGSMKNQVMMFGSFHKRCTDG